MSGSARARRGQTAIEMLFILGIILTGIVVIAPLYTQESGESFLVAAVRGAASQAAVYIEAGVVSDKPRYEDLNEIIQDYTEYQSVGFRLAGVSLVSESNGKVTVAVKFTHDLSPEPTRDSGIAGKIGEFLKDYLKDVNGFYLEDGHLYYRGSLVEFKIAVGETLEVIS